MGRKVVVGIGECLASIAVAHGHLPKILEDAPENTALLEARPDPYSLLNDVDEIFVPDLVPKTVDISINQRSTFLRKGVPEVLRIRFTDADKQPRGGLPYLFEIAGEARSGELGEDGIFEEWVPLDATTAILTLADPERGRERYELQLSQLAPVEELEGIQNRLRNLGYGYDDEEGILAEAAEEALDAFYRDEGLDGPAPEPAEDARERLDAEHIA